MRKKLLLSLATLAALAVSGVLAFMFRMEYEPNPNKNEVEEMVDAEDLTEFGNVEGSYLYTPKNYGYYNSDSIFIVNKFLGRGEEYGGQYVVIKQGEELTAHDKLVAEHTEKEYGSGRLNNVQVKSRHKVLVYKEDKKVKEEWFFKITFTHHDKHYLSFVSPAPDEKHKLGFYQFSFFPKGYEPFIAF